MRPLQRARPVAELPEETLLAGFAHGDEQCTLAFVRRFQARVYGVAAAVLADGHAAEDVAQLAFERAWRHADSYDPRRGSVASWLTSITRNAAIDAARVRRPLPLEPSELLAHLDPAALAGAERGPETAALTGESLAELRAALAALPAEQARAVLLAGVGGMSASEVAAAEQIPLGTAKTRIRTAMQRLRRALAEAGDVGERHG